MDSVAVDGQQLAVVDSFCYLGDNISAGGGCEAATVTRIRAACVIFSMNLKTEKSRLDLCYEQCTFTS